MGRRRLLKHLRQRLGSALSGVDVGQGLSAIIETITYLRQVQPSEPIIIGIAGGSGSGKTSQVANGLMRAFGDEVVAIPMDNYYRGAAALEAFDHPVSWDEPDAIDLELLAKHVVALRAGQVVEMPVYSFEASERVGHRPLRPKRIIIVEGLFTLHNTLLSQLDLRVYVTVDIHGQVIRRLLRDITRTKQAPADILRYMAETVIPMHRRFVEKLRPKADLVLANEYRPETESAKRRYAGAQLKLPGWPEPSRLEELGAEHLGCLDQVDTYLESPTRQLQAHGEILRFRTEGQRTTMTYKGPMASESGERFVFSCGLDDATVRSLKSLYHETQTVVRKERNLYLLQDMVLQLDCVTITTGPGGLMVTEKLVTELRLLPGRTGDARPVIEEMFSRLGLEGRPTGKSYDWLVREPGWFIANR